MQVRRLQSAKLHTARTQDFLLDFHALILKLWALFVELEEGCGLLISLGQSQVQIFILHRPIGFGCCRKHYLHNHRLFNNPSKRKNWAAESRRMKRPEACLWTNKSSCKFWVVNCDNFCCNASICTFNSSSNVSCSSSVSSPSVPKPQRVSHSHSHSHSHTSSWHP